MVWRRYGLRLGVLGLTAAWGCFDYGPGSPGSAQYVAARRESAEQTLRDAGAQLEFKNYGIGKAWTVNLDGKEINDDIVDAIIGLPYVTELHVAGTSITDEQLTRIGEFKGYWLLNIDVSNTEIGNDGIAFLKELKHVEKLNVNDSKISSEFLDALLKERAATPGIRTKEIKLTQ